MECNVSVRSCQKTHWKSWKREFRHSQLALLSIEECLVAFSQSLELNDLERRIGFACLRECLPKLNDLVVKAGRESGHE